MIATHSILQDASEFVFNQYTRGMTDGHLYHTYKHTFDTVESALEIGRGVRLSESDLEIVTLAAWFHDTGHVETFDGHEQRSSEVARQFLQEHGYAQEKIDAVVACILATRYPQRPTTLAEAVVCDADMVHLGQKNYAEYAALLREELRRRMGKEFTDVQWVQANIDFLTNHRFHTAWAQDQYNRQRLKNIARLQKRLRELIIEQSPSNGKSLHEKEPKGHRETKEPHEKEPKTHRESKEPHEKEPKGSRGTREAEEGEVKAEKPTKPGLTDVQAAEKEARKLAKEAASKTERGIETMFRTTSRNHLDLSAMADSKSNILLSINALIISIVVSLLIRKLEEVPEFLIPTIILLTVCLSTVVFATIATRPKVTKGVFSTEDIHQKKVNLLFFGNFHNMSLDDYQWGMQEMMNDREYLYGSMIKDIYFLGQVLGRKYQYLWIAYNIFMYGILVSVAAFVIAYIVAPPTPPFTPATTVQAPVAPDAGPLELGR